MHYLLSPMDNFGISASIIEERINELDYVVLGLPSKEKQGIYLHPVGSHETDPFEKKIKCAWCGKSISKNSCSGCGADNG